MTFKIVIASHNVSDYVVQIGQVPIISSNDDYSLVADGYSFTLSDQTTYTPDEDDICLFTIDDVVYHNGYIKTIDYVYEDHQFTITVEHQLTKLHNYKFNYSSIHTQVETYDQAQTINGLSYNIITPLGLMQAILAKIGFSVTYSALQSESFGQSLYYDSSYLVHSHIFATDENIYFHTAQLYSIGQNGVYQHSSIDSDANLVKDEPDLFDVLSYLFSLMGYVLYPTNSTTFALLNKRTPYAIGTDILQNAVYPPYNEENVRKKSGLIFHFSTLKLHPYTYWFIGTSGEGYIDTDYTSDPFIEYSFEDPNGSNSYNAGYPNNFNPFYLASGDAYILIPDYSTYGLTKYWYTAYRTTRILQKIYTDITSGLLSDLRACKKIEAVIGNNEPPKLYIEQFMTTFYLK